MTAGMFGARDMFTVYEQAIPNGIEQRVHGVEVNVVQNLTEGRTQIRARIGFEVALGVDHESVVVNGDDGLMATGRKIIDELERLGAEAFAPMLAEREERLVHDRDEAIARVIALESRLATIAFAATSDEAELDRLREEHPFLARAIEEGQP